jgi:hypothetical protein
VFVKSSHLGLLMDVLVRRAVREPRLLSSMY